MPKDSTATKIKAHRAKIETLESQMSEHKAMLADIESALTDTDKSISELTELRARREGIVQADANIRAAISQSLNALAKLETTERRDELLARHRELTQSIRSFDKHEKDTARWELVQAAIALFESYEQRHAERDGWLAELRLTEDELAESHDTFPDIDLTLTESQRCFFDFYGRFVGGERQPIETDEFIKRIGLPVAPRQNPHSACQDFISVFWSFSRKMMGMRGVYGANHHTNDKKAA